MPEAVDALLIALTHQLVSDPLHLHGSELGESPRDSPAVEYLLQGARSRELKGSGLGVPCANNTKVSPARYVLSADPSSEP